MDNEALLDMAADLGYELAISGAETFRVEESVSRVLATYGLQAEVFAIPNLLIVSLIQPDGHNLTRVRRIGSHDNDLDAVEKYNALSRVICNRRPEPQAAQEMFSRVKGEHLLEYPVSIQHLGAFFGGAGFSLFFGGRLADFFCAGICGVVINLVRKFLTRRRANPFFQTIAAAFLMALLAYGLGALGLTDNPDAVTIGALMLLVPGLLFTNAMRDIIYGDTNSGVNRIVQVFLIGVAIALGTATAWRFATVLWGMPQSVPATSYSIPAQCIFVFISCCGFAVLFNIHGPGMLLCALGGFLSWAVYLLVLETGRTDLMAYFWSGLFSSVYSEIMARIRKCPAISYLVVSIFPMIPGAGVYQTMSHALQREMDAFAKTGLHTAAIAGILAVGILLGSTVFRMYSDWHAKRR